MLALYTNEGEVVAKKGSTYCCVAENCNVLAGSANSGLSIYSEGENERLYIWQRVSGKCKTRQREVKTHSCHVGTKKRLHKSRGCDGVVHTFTKSGNRECHG